MCKHRAFCIFPSSSMDCSLKMMPLPKQLQGFRSLQLLTRIRDPLLCVVLPDAQACYLLLLLLFALSWPHLAVADLLIVYGGQLIAKATGPRQREVRRCNLIYAKRLCTSPRRPVAV